MCGRGGAQPSAVALQAELPRQVADCQLACLPPPGRKAACLLGTPLPATSCCPILPSLARPACSSCTGTVPPCPALPHVIPPGCWAPTCCLIALSTCFSPPLSPPPSLLPCPVLPSQVLGTDMFPDSDVASAWADVSGGMWV